VNTLFTSEKSQSNIFSSEAFNLGPRFTHLPLSFHSLASSFYTLGSEFGEVLISLPQFVDGSEVGWVLISLPELMETTPITLEVAQVLITLP